ncbi:MAG: carboxylesterase family protein [Phenylobacterium sp.]|uniref:carboxylesterase/lipase family protein n=1 Tax=Phenylobacterium sp. TaxID=1871053 RepID=UPI0027336482|nr:carboxylesterase family protein [Phenylobacterium sp.]MDP3174664.1 carboxylesterase family protein [Phenylobacterium sp.]
MSPPDIHRRWVLAAGAGLMVAPAFAQTSALAAAPVVETTSGRVRGRDDAGVLSFLGVPYGEPTGGANRFMPPKPRYPWPGVRDCLEYGNSAPQVVGTPPAGHYPTPIPTSPPSPESEDCLMLNVWTPSTLGARAVMVWLHGGGLAYGSGSSRWTAGAAFARRHDMVVVTINHRLNTFGFTDLSAHGEQYAASGNVSIADCALALSWVRDNVGRFGGDPRRVMIVGESGGGSKVSTLMAFSPAKGLFHAAVTQSGVLLRADDRERAAAKTQRLLAELNLGPAEAVRLHDVPTEQLRAAGARANRGYGGWRPVIDGVQLARHPFDPDAPAMSRDVPLITGTNRTEESLFMGTDPAMDSLSNEGLRASIAAVVPPGEADRVLGIYKRLYAGHPNAEIAYCVATDRGYFLDSTLMAERKAAAGGAPAWSYVFARETPVQGGRYYAPHASEIPFVFDTLNIAAASSGPVTPAAQALAVQMSTVWANFAKSGMPSAPGLPAWPAYEPGRRATMVFDAPGGGAVRDDPRSEERELMAGFGSRQLQPPTPAPVA